MSKRIGGTCSTTGCLEPAGHPGRCNAVNEQYIGQPQARVIADLERELEEARKALQKYSTHGSGCLAIGWKRGDNEYRCSCGLDATLDRILRGTKEDE